jgi:hypothetical protein
VVSGGSRWFQMVSDGFRWFQVVSDGLTVKFSLKSISMFEL